MIPVIDPKIGSDGAPPRRTDSPTGWHEHRGQWTAMSKPRMASVMDFGGYLMVFAGVSTETSFDPAVQIKADNPRQLLDAMIRADRFVAGGE